MSILDAATSPTVGEAAYGYIEAGCSIIPVQGKVAVGSWREYQFKRPTSIKVSQWLRSRQMSGIGLVCGEVSGGLVVIDVDSRAACIEFEAEFPMLTDTLTIRSGSGRGNHYYFYAVDILPANTWRDGVELRANKAYVVAPPSLHPVSGLAYCVVRAAAVRKTNLLVEVRRWIAWRGVASAPIPTSPAPMSSKNAYGQAALAGECDRVRAAPEGSANTALYRAALKMGSLIASGVLAQGEVEAALEGAAAELSRRDGLNATRRTIAGGMRIGMGSPRPVKS